MNAPGALPGAAGADEFVDPPNATVGVFWDYENVRIPRNVRATRAAAALRDAVLPFGQILERRVYYDSRRAAEFSLRNTDSRASLDQSGFTLVDCPTRGEKETLDKKLIVDVMQFVFGPRGSANARPSSPPPAPVVPGRPSSANARGSAPVRDRARARRRT